METAREAKVDLRVVEDLNLDQLRPRDVLLWLYPPPSLPDAALERFVEDGGHLIVADDVGASDALLARFGVKKLPPGAWRPSRWVDGDERLAALKPAQEHFLFFNVHEIVANAPVALDPGEATPLLSFSPAPTAPRSRGTSPHEPALVVEARRGRGALLAIGDPSIFVNAMLRRFYGDKQFAANVMRLYCGRAPCQVSLLLPWTRVEGTYHSNGGALAALSSLFDTAAEELDRAAARAERAASTPPWSWALALATLGLLALGVPLTAAQGRRHPAEPLRGSPPPAAPPSVREAQALTRARQVADFRDLAAPLVAEIERLRTRGRLASIEEQPLPPKGDGGARDRAARALLRIQQEATSLAKPGAPPMGSQRFQRLHDDVTLVTRFVASAPGGRAGSRPPSRARSQAQPQTQIQTRPVSAHDE